MAIDQYGNYVPDLNFNGTGNTQSQPSYANPAQTANMLQFGQPAQMSPLGTAPVNQSPNTALLNMNQPQAAQATPGFFDSVSGADWLNFGGGLLQTGLGIYYQNQALDQSQQALDLSRDKYNNYLAEQESLDRVSADRAAAAKAQGAGV